MRLIAQGVDPVRLSFLMALLRDAGIGCVLLDQHISAVEGGIGVLVQRPDGDRVLVVDPKRGKVAGEIRLGR